MSVGSRIRSRFRAEFAAQLVVVVAGGLLMVVLARLLGPDEYGLLFLAIAVFGTLQVLSKLGLAKSGARYVATYKEQDDGQLRHVLRTTLGLNLVAVAVVGIGLFVAHGELATLLGEPSLETLLLFGVAFLAFEALKTYVRMILQGFEAIELAAAIHAIDQGTRFLFAVGFVLLGFGALGALAGWILGFLVASAVGLLAIYRRYYRDSPAAPIESGLRRRIAEYAVPLTATNTANVLDKEIDTVLVGFFLTPVAVSYYVLSKQVIQFVETPVEALGFTLSPTFGAQKAAGTVDRAARLYETALVHALLCYVPIAAGVLLVAEPTIQLVFGADYLGAVVVLQVLSLYAVLQAVTKLTSNGLDFLGRARDRAIVKGGTAAANVGLNVVLIPTVGVVGAAIATVVTYSLYTFANVYIIHQEFDLRLGYLARRLAVVTGITAVMAAVVAVAVSHVDGFLTLIGVIGLGAAVWATLSVATGFLDRDTLGAVTS